MTENANAARLSRARRSLMSWGTGRGPGTGAAGRTATATVVLEDAGHLGDLLASDLVDADSVVFVPGRYDQERGTGPLVIGYDGSLAEPGSDLSLDDSFFLQSQDYATSAYMSVIGATLVRIFEEADFEAFLADADRARAEGVFPSFATDPAVQPADVGALGAGPDGDGPGTRLYVTADGALSLSPAGLPLGALGDGFADVVAGWEQANARSAAPCAVALGGAVPEDVRARALAGRPWAGRCLAALDAVRELRARGVGDVRVSGFGGRLLPGLDTEGRDLADARLPLLLWTEDAAYVHSPLAGRTFQVSLAAGRLAEALLVHGSPAEAAAAPSVAEGPLTEVAAFFAGAGVPLVAGELAGAGR
ncbi:daptide biosynthesis RiPP recognition protein [Streptomyces sp. NPDC047017]|uniref:daptide biosynthesis RiPP recognition protein n=1 Tax=Streptomyces sp. NPDC047017 TaxID=3155024 RepID=UPI0033F4B879